MYIQLIHIYHGLGEQEEVNYMSKATRILGEMCRWVGLTQLVSQCTPCVHEIRCGILIGTR